MIPASPLRGFLAAVAGLVGFTAIAEEVGERAGIVMVDRDVLEFVGTHRTPDVVAAMGLVTHLGGAIALLIVAVLGGLAVGVARRSWAPPILLAVTLVGAGVAVWVLKGLIARPRPPAALAVYIERGYGFPSGHTTHATAGYLMLAVLVTVTARRRWVRVTAWVSAMLVVAAVGVSRVVLGVHAPSDVLAGWLLGLSWVALVASVWWSLKRTRLVRAVPARSAAPLGDGIVGPRNDRE
ncbi:MAG: phosphatase PAP2 family protein [Streptomycetales bacterium]